MKVTLEEFYSHTVDSTVGHLLLKDKALELLEPVFENFPFLDGAVYRDNPYRIHVMMTDFELFFLPAMKYCEVIKNYES